MSGPEICTTTAGAKQHLSRNLTKDELPRRQAGRVGRTLCGHTGFDQELVDWLIDHEQMRRCKPIADLPPCRACLNSAGMDGTTVFRLSVDQLHAVRALLGLVHYDDLAQSWLDTLPDEFKPEGTR